jgi:hypothetical protein
MNTAWPVVPVHVLYLHDNGEHELTLVDGERVAPGLAITPDPAHQHTEVDGWALTHTPSGLRLTPFRHTCRRHVELAAQIAADSGVDWTGDAATVRSDPRACAAYIDMVWRCGPCGECPTQTVQADR